MDEVTTTEQTEQPAETVSIEEFNAVIAERDKLKANNQSLVGEKRTATQKAADLEAEKLKITEEKLKKEGDYEALMKLAQEKADEYERKTLELDSIKKAGVLNKASLLIGSELSKDTSRVEAIQGWAEKYIVVDDSGQVGYEVDGVPVDKQKVKELITAKYPWAVDGVDSSGGGAGGGSKETVTTNTKAQEAQKNGDVTGFLNASLNIK